MPIIQATKLRASLSITLKELARSKKPIEIWNHHRPIAIIMPITREMAGSRKPTIDKLAIKMFCKKHQLKMFALFGSILRKDFGYKSDVDVLIDPDDRFIDWHETCEMGRELENMFDRKVDVMTMETLRSGRINPIVRRYIENSYKVIHEEVRPSN